MKIFVALTLLLALLGSLFVVTSGEEEGCFCIALFDPVCGVDGKTYGNGCSAGCAKVAVNHKGECNSGKQS